MTARLVTQQADWDAAAAALPAAHVLQSWEWGECKMRFGWEAQRLIWEDKGSPTAAAQILRRTVRIGPFSARLFYVPKGPLLCWEDPPLRDAVLSRLETVARSEEAIQIKIDPDVILARGAPGSENDRPEASGAEVLRALGRRGWRLSPEQVQFRNTVLLDIRPEENALLASMKPKTRYNIRLAQRHGVAVREGSEEDLPLLYRMYAETADRDSFVIRSGEYYAEVWREMMRSGRAQPLLAEVEGLPVSALILFHFADRGWYFYGMSRTMHREKMPNHLLQWEAVRWLKRHGYAYYDLWGAPDDFHGSDPMQGVLKFKLGFGGEVTRSLGAWDWTPFPLRYEAYHRLLPRLLDVTRLLARRRTGRLADSTRGIP